MQSCQLLRTLYPHLLHTFFIFVVKRHLIRIISFFSMNTCLKPTRVYYIICSIDLKRHSMSCVWMGEAIHFIDFVDTKLPMKCHVISLLLYSSTWWRISLEGKKKPFFLLTFLLPESLKCHPETEQSIKIGKFMLRQRKDF